MSEGKEITVHGRWIKKRLFKSVSVDELAMVECSNCETLFKAVWNKSNYCPVCGARMDEIGTSTPLDNNGNAIEDANEMDYEYAWNFLCSLCGSRHATKYDCPECGGTLRPAIEAEE